MATGEKQPLCPLLGQQTLTEILVPYSCGLKQTDPLLASWNKMVPPERRLNLESSFPNQYLSSSANLFGCTRSLACVTLLDFLGVILPT